MKNIIEHIAQIDAAAFKNEQGNKSLLARERQHFENEMKKYREMKLKAAESSAKTAYEQIVSKAQSEYREKEAILKKTTWQLENNYKKVEDELIKRFFDMLFAGGRG